MHLLEHGVDERRHLLACHPLVGSGEGESVSPAGVAASTPPVAALLVRAAFLAAAPRVVAARWRSALRAIVLQVKHFDLIRGEVVVSARHPLKYTQAARAGIGSDNGVFC